MMPHDQATAGYRPELCVTFAALQIHANLLRARSQEMLPTRAANRRESLHTPHRSDAIKLPPLSRTRKQPPISTPDRLISKKLLFV
jgi:hypothetical protein